MMTKTQLPAAANSNFGESLTMAQKDALQCAVAKIVAFGAQVGVSADEMIQMLQSGLTVGELLQYLAGRTGEVV
ncbi:MAG: hypothetical protein ABSG02_13615 [Terriglobales bacterium]